MNYEGQIICLYDGCVLKDIVLVYSAMLRQGQIPLKARNTIS